MSKVKVRIAVAVDPKGGWNSSGWSIEGRSSDEDAMIFATEAVGDGEVRYWVEAELDIPEPSSISTVQGTVTPA